ncbi:MAG TPA: selenide, water dikinase SelD [Acidimicrobiales bacterium]|nr:selenide, water dikinase SelD [Acidimicrobiales bacterium]
MSDAGVRLTELTSCGGCAAKWGASLLGDLVASARLDGGRGAGPNGGADLLVGLAPSDDAAVARLTDEVALVSTIDFFPPLVDDPADYGAIAAANACSDVFAMGGDVLLALNVAAFPESLPPEVIRAIFRAAAEVVASAGGVVAGGHTIRSPEPIFGLAVQGVVAPGRQFTTGGARPGDVLVLSKPLGTGLALASGVPATVAAAVASMRRLNRDAAGALRRHPAAVHAVTDVTGFGLVGHGWEMAERSGARVVFTAAALPLLGGVGPAAEAGVRTGGDARNRNYVAGNVTLEAGEAAAAVAFDPQTSGGLLAAVDAAAAEDLAGAGFVPVGHVAAGPPAVTLR